MIVQFKDVVKEYGSGDALFKAVGMSFLPMRR